MKDSHISQLTKVFIKLIHKSLVKTDYNHIIMHINVLMGKMKHWTYYEYSNMNKCIKS